MAIVKPNATTVDAVQLPGVVLVVQRGAAHMGRLGCRAR